MKKLTLTVLIFSLILLANAGELLELSNYDGIKEELPIKSIYGTSGTVVKNVTGNFTKEIFEVSKDNGSVIDVKDLNNKSFPNKPTLPVKNLEITLTGKYDIKGIEVSSSQLFSGKTKGALTTSQKRVKWYKKLFFNRDKKTYQKNEFYPGNWSTFTAGYNGKETKIYLHLYPIQWNPVTKEFYYLSDYSIDIYGENVIEDTSYRTRDIETSDAEHILICPQAWESVADSIASFHANLNIESDVVTLEEIYSNYEPVEGATAVGYTTNTNHNIENYNYDNAKEITAYLRDNAKHPNLTNITLVGSGHILPPSYYFFYQEAMEGPGEEYFAWIPSDHYYSSPDYDFVDNFGSSRITVSTLEELSAYFHKMVDWVDSWDPSWTHNASVGGSAAFETPLFCGELMCNQVISDDIFSNYNIQKFYRTLGNFTRNDLSNHLQNDDFLWHFHVSHGSGNSISFDDETELFNHQLMSYPQKDKLGIFLSVACINGAYDTELYQEYWSGISFAEAIIRSQGAGIAYIGGTRPNSGMSDFSINNGNIAYQGVDDTYALLYYYLQAYRELNNPTFGDLFRKAKDKYLAEQDMTDSMYEAAYVRFIAHADAGLTLPIKPEFVQQDNVAMVNLENAEGVNDFAQYGPVNTSEGASYTLSEAGNYNLNSYDIQAEFGNEEPHLYGFSDLVSSLPINNNFNIALNNGEHFILNRVEDQVTGKEAIHYSELSVNITSNENDMQTPNFNMNVYPNPFNPSTNISFSIAKDEEVDIKVFNIKGQIVKSLTSGKMKKGRHSLTWNGRDNNNKPVSSSVYFVKIKTKNKSINKKIVLMK
jgi:hypothetical protein